MTSVSATRAACTAPARDPGTVSARRAGEVSSVTRTSTTAPTTGRVATGAPATTPGRDPTRVSVHLTTPAPTVRSLYTRAPCGPVSTVGPVFGTTLATEPSPCAPVPLVSMARAAKLAASPAPTHPVATAGYVNRALTPSDTAVAALPAIPVPTAA